MISVIFTLSLASTPLKGEGKCRLEIINGSKNIKTKRIFFRWQIS